MTETHTPISNKTAKTTKKVVAYSITIDAIIDMKKIVKKLRKIKLDAIKSIREAAQETAEITSSLS